MTLRKTALALAGLCFGMLAAGPAPAADPPTASRTLAGIRARSSVVCGVQNDNPPFSLPDSQGQWRGMDVDSCRALAAATLGDAAKVTIRPITGLTRFPSLQSGEVDVLFGSTTWTTTRESALGLVFAGANYYSGQGFLVHSRLGVKTLKELDGASVCVPPGSTTELIMQDWARKNGVSFQPVVIDDPNQIQSTFLSGRCDAFTRDLTGLSGFRSRQGKPEAYTLLPEFISMEPLGAFIRKGDDGWLDIVRWTQLALVAAEQMGVTAGNAADQAASANPDIRRLLGSEGEVGPSMGLEKGWALAAIRAVGNYGEMWERNVRPMGLERGNNRLWDQGGLMFAPPLR
ncbi:amino acid ABC transporter substrate-binding protein [Teichococcus aestuarii]|uniref:amino acid ABC transporter substrate-binding protein n=1 Tax=Teichococcus aestuarii TaxID=568898 RepID=UPI0036093619